MTKKEIETKIKIEIAKNNIKNAIDICEKNGISSKEFGKLIKEVNNIIEKLILIEK